MGRRRLLGFKDNGSGLFSNPGIGFPCCSGDENRHPGGLFSSIGQMGIGFGITPNYPNSTALKLPYLNLYSKYMLPEPGFEIVGIPELVVAEAEVVEENGFLKRKKKKKNGNFRLKIKVGNPSLRRLISGAIAGAVSRTSVAPFETIKTHLMVGISCGHSMKEVFEDIMKNEGWKGLFRGNLVNVIRVAPSKAIELFVYDTVKEHLTTKPGEEPKLPIPASPIAGAMAGITSTLCTYPLELLKTRITIQKGLYKNLFDAFLKIVQEEGPAELYRGLTPSLIGVVPYAATNYFAYDTLRKAYKKIFDREEIGNIATLLMGSTAGAISSTATFPMEVARRHMQAGALNGRQYKNMLHTLVSILEQEGIPGLYRGLGPSYMKLIPAAGISFMCYEACKRILVEKEDDQ